MGIVVALFGQILVGLIVCLPTLFALTVRMKPEFGDNYSL